MPLAPLETNKQLEEHADNSGILRTGSFEVHLRYIKTEEGWSISVSMQPIDTKLSEKTKLVTKAHFDKQLSQ